MKTYIFEKTISYKNGTKNVEILKETTDDNESSVMYEFRTLAECIEKMHKRIKSVRMKLVETVPA